MRAQLKFLTIGIFLVLRIPVSMAQNPFIFNEKTDRFFGRYFNPMVSAGIGMDRAASFMPSAGLKVGPFTAKYSLWDNFEDVHGEAFSVTAHIFKLQKDENPIRVLGFAFNQYQSRESNYQQIDELYQSYMIDISGYRVGSRLSAYFQLGGCYVQTRFQVDNEVKRTYRAIPMVGFGIDLYTFRMPEWGRWGKEG
ncbi:MAG: hypothetical protein H6608_05720 [Flavobacteriales bacterium]|nr:hypothetical protein [Bacteroidota bacterium]MCB9240605.1 hypothetical protein [Flavobacteriales bacterium]